MKIVVRRIRLSLLAAVAMTMFAGSAFADGPFQFFPITPCRIADTRNPNGLNGGPILQPGVTRDFQVRGRCGVPTTAKAAALNVTITNPSGHSWITIWPSGTPLPGISTINFAAGDPPTANGAITPLSTNSLDLSVLNANGTVHVILDVTGYFQ